MTIRELAIYFAGAKHRDQAYGDGALYVHHLAAVDKVLEDAGHPSIGTVRIAAWLHDTMEDCGVTQEEIEKLFGPEVAECVWCVTNEPGENRKERAKKTYPKIKSTPQSLSVKLADRIANIENSLLSNSRFALMYYKEHSDFYKALDGEKYRLEHYYLWNRYVKAVNEVKDKYGIEN